jgi:hypothetical protein
LASDNYKIKILDSANGQVIASADEMGDHSYSDIDFMLPTVDHCLSAKIEFDYVSPNTGKILATGVVPSDYSYDCKVTFMDKDGAVLSSSDSVQYNTKKGVNIPTQISSPFGMKFKEWNTKQDGSGVSYDNYSTFTSDVVFYPIFEPEDVAVNIINSQTNALVTSTDTLYNQSILQKHSNWQEPLATDPALSYFGYILSGWELSNGTNCSVKVGLNELGSQVINQSSCVIKSESGYLLTVKALFEKATSPILTLNSGSRNLNVIDISFNTTQKGEYYYIIHSYAQDSIAPVSDGKDLISKFNNSYCSTSGVYCSSSPTYIEPGSAASFSQSSLDPDESYVVYIAEESDFGAYSNLLKLSYRTDNPTLLPIFCSSYLGSESGDQKWGNIYNIGNDSNECISNNYPNIGTIPYTPEDSDVNLKIVSKEGYYVQKAVAHLHNLDLILPTPSCHRENDGSGALCFITLDSSYVNPTYIVTGINLEIDYTNQISLKVGRVSGIDREYDGTTQTTILGTPELIESDCNPDSEICSSPDSNSEVDFGTPSAVSLKFYTKDKNVILDEDDNPEYHPVYAGGFTLSGPLSYQYCLDLADPDDPNTVITTAKFKITPARLSSDSINITKVYDQTKNITKDTKFSGGELTNPFSHITSQENVHWDYTTAVGSFSQAQVGDNLDVNITDQPIVDGNQSLGFESVNYQQPSFTSVNSWIGSITPKSLTAQIKADSYKVYDGNSNDNFSEEFISSPFSGDDIQLNCNVIFVDDLLSENPQVDVGNYYILPICNLSGLQATQYTLELNTAQIPETGEITPKGLNYTVQSVISKFYDGTAEVTIEKENVVIDGEIESDKNNLSLLDYEIINAKFADKEVANNKSLNFSIHLLGTKSNNYIVNKITSTTANI